MIWLLSCLPSVPLFEEPVGWDCVDADQDGFCVDEDCDDGDAFAYPCAFELCDGRDDDCDGSRDELSAIDAPTWYADGDGHGDPGVAATRCSHVGGWELVAGDCDDTAADISPDADEICNGVDDDCDGVTDPDWYTSSLNAGITQISLNASAVQIWDGSDGMIRLTSDAGDEVGSALFIDVIPGATWAVTFDVWIGGTTAGDGMALLVLDESDATLVGDELAAEGLKRVRHHAGGRAGRARAGGLADGARRGRRLAAGRGVAPGRGRVRPWGARGLAGRDLDPEDDGVPDAG
ncbi:MAG: hypothetical protein GY913_22715 [Proteobacteria bacterium]|nr:hypothetical protein [Pseudomonadota bacterium]MCP4919723.1 hypothetical protein [Pseudomonadota bacterium]